MYGKFEGFVQKIEVHEVGVGNVIDPVTTLKETCSRFGMVATHFFVIFHRELWGKIPILTSIFLKGVETTN